MTRSGESGAAEAFSRAAVAVFRLNGRFTAALDRLALPSGLSAARWQILSSVAAEQLSVSDVARRVGTSRQSVQRIADLLVAQGLAAYSDNPAHRRAKLLAATEQGLAAMREVDSCLAELTRQLSERLGGAEETRRFSEVLRGLSDTLSSLPAAEAPRPEARSGRRKSRPENTPVFPNC
ncbi:MULTISPECIES: MarR family winged helix-turn-helix transcriptional regulator [Streptomyces]|uniref:MarR family winged helix-turn-helix transcriptional regulator n=1 Tax=Streptomyces TaxID=1883 RepID=UPI00226EFA49|nr:MULTISPECIES: MarR family transcriptional regulator [unclassified Streptomyces]MCY0941736.1 MarR family transcriptional regulator [Streptomyces sp. H34-AA3]MCY0949329.1 MarR family transcriptional regulator [Streptomyces sp. H27-S2]MCZ4081554.1 MarR family transcriptional regulator [Streptomyces sp. H34-S5]